MADSFHSLNYHFIWSTKGRVPWITQDIEERVWQYISGIALKKRMTPLCIGGYEDHIHALVRLPANMDVSKAIQLLKGTSSKWIHESLPALRGFEWQDGYGAFTVAKSGIPAAFKYIKNQRRHHAKKSFQDEFRAFLVKHEIEFDEEYLWG
jgi:REP element-mobilizing transposase RayT